MLWLLFFIYVGVCLAMMASAFWRREDRMQFPFLAGATVILMVCVPLYGLMLDTTRPADASITRFLIMAILCQLASWAGYNYSWESKTLSNYSFNLRRLSISAVLLAAFGFYFAYRLSNTEIQLSEDTNQWTGLATVLFFFSSVSRYGFVLAAILYFRTKDWRFLLVMIPQMILYGTQFLAGRRSPTGEFLIIVMTLLFFYTKKCIPLWLLVPGMVIMATFSYNIGLIRSTTDQPFIERVQGFVAAKPLESLSAQGQSEQSRYIEIHNSINFMEAKALGGHYDRGLHFWNQLVFGFVPAQFVGADFKKALQFDLTDDTALTGFEKNNGSCESGIAEAFMAFGYFGCALFFIMGASFRWLWDQSVRGNVPCQLVLMLNMLGGVMSYTIQLWTILNGLVCIVIFTGPFLWWSAKTPHRARKVNLPKRRPASAPQNLASDVGSTTGLDSKAKTFSVK